MSPIVTGQITYPNGIPHFDGCLHGVPACNLIRGGCVECWSNFAEAAQFRVKMLAERLEKYEGTEALRCRMSTFTAPVETPGGNEPVRWSQRPAGDYVLQWLDTDMVTWREVPFVRAS